MGEVSDIEDLLRKAKRHATVVAWIKVGLVSASTCIGAAFGAGMTAARYLDQLMTKDQGAKLFEGQQQQLHSLQDANQLLVGRVAACEMKDGFQDQLDVQFRADLKDLQLRAGTLVRTR